MLNLHKSMPNRLTIISVCLFVGFSSLAQQITDPTKLSKNAFAWTQEERELGFAHYDEVFPGRVVPNGDHVRELSPGAPIVAFSDGGEMEEEFNRFLKEQYVAGLLIMQDGKIRLERYDLGHSPDLNWTSQSCAKSVTSTLVGAAIKDGYIGSVDDYVVEYISDLKGSAYDSVTVHHLLSMSTGVKWYESFTDPESDLFKYYVTPIDSGVDQTVSYLRRLPAQAKPGVRWVYNTAETNLLGVLVTSATGKTLAEYLSEKIWAPYGMEEDASWIINYSDQELAGCCLQARLRDFARFGQFVLDGGKIDGESVVPEGWFDVATKSQMPLWPGWGYGYQWWALTDGTFRALGIHGQMIHIDPSRRLVIAVNSAWPEAENMARQVAASSFVGMVAGVIDAE